MEPFKRVRGKILPLPRADVDTDQIIPAKYLKRIERTGFGEFAFDAWRKDPNFVLNDHRYDGAEILVTGPNFGCGSSREHAPWALQQMGLKAIVAPSYRLSLSTKFGSLRQAAKANSPKPVRSIRFRYFAGMIWSVSTSARGNGRILPRTFLNGSINLASTCGYRRSDLRSPRPRPSAG